MNSEEELKAQIKKAQDEYYQEHNKNRFFKNNQKLECAKSVSEKVDLQQLINLTYFNIPNTNKVYFNYPLFKTFGSDEVRDPLYIRFLNVIDSTIKQYGHFEMHCNLQSFTVSAAQRYYYTITSSIDDNDDFSKNMTSLYVYHTPNVISQIVTLLSKSVTQFKNITTFHTKEESDELIRILFEHV